MDLFGYELSKTINFDWVHTEGIREEVATLETWVQI